MGLLTFSVFFSFVLRAKDVLTFSKHSITFYIIQLETQYYSNIDVLQ